MPLDEHLAQSDPGSQAPPAAIAAATPQPAAWTMIETGRYQPRRIKGSCLGRELG